MWTLEDASAEMTRERRKEIEVAAEVSGGRAQKRHVQKQAIERTKGNKKKVEREVQIKRKMEEEEEGKRERSGEALMDSLIK